MSEASKTAKAFTDLFEFMQAGDGCAARARDAVLELPGMLARVQHLRNSISALQTPDRGEQTILADPSTVCAASDSATSRVRPALTPPGEIQQRHREREQRATQFTVSERFDEDEHVGRSAAR